MFIDKPISTPYPGAVEPSRLRRPSYPHPFVPYRRVLSAIPNIRCEHDSTPWNHITSLTHSFSLYLVSFWIAEFSAVLFFYFLFSAATTAVAKNSLITVACIYVCTNIYIYIRSRIAEPDAPCAFSLFIKSTTHSAAAAAAAGYLAFFPVFRSQ